jgi:hypothetical protein
MTTVEQVIPTIRTKLHQPRVAVDLVCLAGPRDRLGAGRQVPTLGATPAGYGKITAMTHWLHVGDIPLVSVPLGEGGQRPADVPKLLCGCYPLHVSQGVQAQGRVHASDPLQRDSFRKPQGNHAMRNHETIRGCVLHFLSGTMAADEMPSPAVAQMACRLPRVRSSVRHSALAFKGA